MDECAFCRVVNNVETAEVIYETDATLAFFPLEPATRGHTLVIPKRHVEHFLDLSPDDIPDLGRTVLHVSRAIRAVLTPEGMNIITSAGAAASQTVMHMHVHLVPRWTGDSIEDFWPPEATIPELVLDDLANALREFCNTEPLGNRNP